ncbi:Fur family transcriptional regulator [Desulfovibrio cuneatus]|uniref:Fur family transcriptional regulator n=1 Tax=Desulfovibrio cuneatus TaxID=159728 RepID=UPI000406F8F7|nr:transcriptional repressor [Desulfovibrio cuneatus]
MADPHQVFTQYIAESGLKNTPQRHTILEVFLSAGKHLSTEELYTEVRAIEKNVGQATVYRTLKLLCEAGLAKELHFGDGIARYEPSLGIAHHDHLICTVCHKNIEFLDNTIEQLQNELASRHGFTLTSHRLYLYGVCADCQPKGNR